MGLAEDAQAMRRWEDAVAQGRQVLEANGLSACSAQLVELPAAIRSLVDEALPYLEFDQPCVVKTLELPELGTYTFVRPLVNDDADSVQDDEIAFAHTFGVGEPDFDEEGREEWDQWLGNVCVWRKPVTPSTFTHRLCRLLIFDDGSMAFVRNESGTEWKRIWDSGGSTTFCDWYFKVSELSMFKLNLYVERTHFPYRPVWIAEHLSEQELREILTLYIKEHGALENSGNLDLRRTDRIAKWRAGIEEERRQAEARRRSEEAQRLYAEEQARKAEEELAEKKQTELAIKGAGAFLVVVVLLLWLLL